MHNKFKLFSTAMIMVVAVFILAGCGKKAPAEANAALNDSLNGLVQKQAAVFVGGVLPAQQKGVVALQQWPFFKALKGFKIDNEFDSGVTDNAAGIMSSLYFDDEHKIFTSMKFWMKKEGGRWYIDLKESIKKQIARDGAQAFQLWEIVEKK